MSKRQYRLRCRRTVWFHGCALLLCLVVLWSVRTTQAAEGVLLQDDFTTVTPDRWTVVDDAVKGAPSNWIVGLGAYKQISAIGNNDKPKYSGTCALAGDAGWGDYTFSVKVRSQMKDGIGIVFRYADAKNHYRFRWSSPEGAMKHKWTGRVLERVVDGKWTVLASDTVGYTDQAYHAVRVRLAGEQIALYLDEAATPLFDVRDDGTPLKHGKIGLYSWGNTGAFFDEVAVYANDAKPPFPLKSTYLVTVTGRVYVDANRNGTPDAGEAGLPGILVSDGAQVTVTDAQGIYTLTRVNAVADRFVFVVTPSGYRTLNGYYLPIAEDKETQTANFALTSAPETANPDFSFVQVTDLHLSGMRYMLAGLVALTRIDPKPAFVLATGDLVYNGRDPGFMASYRKMTDQSPIPLYSIVGNHDELEGEVEMFERNFGPTSYAFDYGGRHFVMFNCITRDLDKRYQWLRRDLALQPKDKEIYFFQHFDPDDKVMALLAEFNTVAVYSGHWHMTRVFTYGKRAIKYVNTPPFLFGGIDTSPNGFALTTFSNGKMTLQSRLADFEKYCVLVSPAEGMTVPQGTLAIDVNAYDSCLPAKVQYQLDNGPWKNMTAAGRFNWQAQEMAQPGEHSMQIRAEFGNEVVKKTARFTVANRQAPVVKLGQDWPMFKRDAARTGATSEVVTPPLLPVWRTNLDGITHISSPVVVGETLYIGVADEEGRGKAGVYALDARTGAVRWHFPASASVKHTVAVANGLVYAASADGLVYAIEAGTGKGRWHYSLGDPLEKWMYSAPLVMDGCVYVGTGTNFVALDAMTGTMRWQNTRLGLDWKSQHASPVADADYLFVSMGENRGFHGLDRRTGKELWKTPGEKSAGRTTPVLAGGTLYCPWAKGLYAIEPATGKELWTVPVPGGRYVSSPVLGGGKVLIGSNSGILLAVDATTGKECWQFQTGTALASFSSYAKGSKAIIGSPAIAGNVVYLGGADGKFYALDLETGKKVWDYQFGVPITSSPAISGNTVYISTYDGTVYAFTQAQ